MKVKLLVARAGLQGAQNVGEEIDVSADEAKRMVDAGQAELVRVRAAEKAVKRRKAEKATK